MVKVRKPIDKAFIEKAIANTFGDVGNDVLYRLCREHPTHTEADTPAINAKIWLIGRSYATAIERRRKNTKLANDLFYERKVVPAMTGIDSWFAGLTHTSDNEAAIVKLHKRLMILFHRLTGLNKRSLASKYLHFHFPNDVFIFDSRAQAAAMDLDGRRASLKTPAGCDPVYGKFFRRCTDLTARFQRLLGREMSPRDLDKVFLAWHRELPHRAA